MINSDMAPMPKKAKTDKSEKKRDAEFEKKKIVALEVSKYPNLFDISHQKYSDKTVETISWKKVSEATGFFVDDCCKLWNSLKRSARYYARVPKIPCKSGAAGASTSIEKKYRDEWMHADCMAFYTPPSLKEPEKMITICNTLLETDTVHDKSAEEIIMDLPVYFEDEDETNVYVRYFFVNNLSD